MSEVVGKQTFKTDRYLMTVLVDGQFRATYAVEGIKDPEWTFQKFLGWFLVMRSKWFDLTPEDIEPIKESATKGDVPTDADIVYTMHCDVKGKQLTAHFSNFRFGVW